MGTALAEMNLPRVKSITATYSNTFMIKDIVGVMGMEHGLSRTGKEGELALIRAYRDSDSFR